MGEFVCLYVLGEVFCVTRRMYVCICLGMCGCVCSHPVLYWVMQSGFASLNYLMLAYFGISTSIKERVWLQCLPASVFLAGHVYKCEISFSG